MAKSYCSVARPTVRIFAALDLEQSEAGRSVVARHCFVYSGERLVPGIGKHCLPEGLELHEAGPQCCRFGQWLLVVNILFKEAASRCRLCKWYDARQI